MHNYIIETVELIDLLKSSEKFNSNNHWENNIKPLDYNERLAATRTHMWIDHFKQNYIVINIDIADIKWMYEANKIGAQTGKFPNYYSDELEELNNKYSKVMSKIFNGQEYFIRTEKVSLKYGEHGVGPYNNFREIIESLVTSIPTHCPLYNLQQNYLKIYLLEWININSDLEFRMFVYNNKITAISQQNIYSPNTLLSNTGKTPDEKYVFVKKHLDILMDYFENCIKHKITHISSYTIDIALVNNRPFFIELNSFGKEYAAGSSLFHWLIDEDKLYNTDNKIFFRYVIDSLNFTE